MWKFYILAGVFKHSGFEITAEDLNHVAVPARHKQELPVGSDSEVPRMHSCVLIADIGQNTCLRVLAEYRQPISFQTVAGIEELPVR